MEIPNIYRGNYKLAAIPALVLIIISLIFIPSIKLGVDFQGGTLLTLALKNNTDAPTLQSQLQNEGLAAAVTVYHTPAGYQAEIEVPQSPNLFKAESLKSQFDALFPIVTNLEVNSYQNSSYTPTYQANLSAINTVSNQMFALAGLNRNSLNITSLNDLQKQFTLAYNLVYSNYQNSMSTIVQRHVSFDSLSVQTVSPTLSSHFIGDAVNVVIMSAILSIILVFLFFRNITPSLAVLSGSISDVTIALGAMGLFGIPLTLPSFAALLMLTGYSLDTDILLTTRVLKRKGNHFDNAYEAMKTGLTMSLMAMVAFGALFILALVTHISVYYEISAVALAGLVGDVFATWGIDAFIVLHDVEKKLKKGSL